MKENIIPFPGSRSPRTRRSHQKAEREILVGIIEEHICHLERAAHSIGRLRTLVEELKALEGWTWKHPLSRCE